ncbi:MAG: hypothetical protein IPK82_41585 [Polyangiaceae bacterium]|nr:hypothetical protein [Polyangiaceae bacterium]
MLQSARAIFLLGAAVFATGCATRYIPNTDVEDSDDNRKVVSFCEKYRHAVELKDVGELIRLASTDYYEDGGNVDAADDLDYAGLRDYLTTRFTDARAIRYEIRYRRVLRQTLPAGEDGESAAPKDAKGQLPLELIFVDFTYSASYKIPSAKGADDWRRKVEDNRLEILRYPDDQFLIVAGM